MKYVVVLGDGMADERYEELGGRSPIEAADIPAARYLAAHGEVGLCQSVPPGMKPGSDVANLSVLGYDPKRFYTGRSPLEAVSMGVELLDEDVTYRCNLVTLSDEPVYEDRTMKDYSAGEISTAEAAELISYLAENLALPEQLSLFPGVSYRHCLRLRGAKAGATETTPPHDISDRKIAGHLPKGGLGELLLGIMKRSAELLADHPVNLARVRAGKNPANSCWFWGEGTRPGLSSFARKTGLSGAVISAVDLVKGIGRLAGMEVIDVPGATGNIHTNFDGKAAAAIDALGRGRDFVYIHLEAPDECGHQGQLLEKVRAIELIDEKVTAPVLSWLQNCGEPFAVMFVPDHPTPVRLRTHTGDPVPYVIYRSAEPREGKVPYSEAGARESGILVEKGYELLDRLIGK